jgi:hypothetical protein
MRGTYLRGPRTTSSCRRSGAIKRRSAILLSGTAAIALSIAQPASAIVIRDDVAAAFGGIENYYDSTNVYSNVVSLRRETRFSNGSVVVDSGCTGSLMNSRTVLTAAHCLFQQPANLVGASFRPDPVDGDRGIPLSGSKPNIGWVDPVNDIAVLSLAQPVTSVMPVRLLTLQQGQPGFPTAGTTITMVGYGTQGTGSGLDLVAKPPNPFPVGLGVAVVWHPDKDVLINGEPPPSPIPTTTPDEKRRVATSSLQSYGPNLGKDQPFFQSKFRNPLTDPTTPLEGGTGAGDSGGPLFAMINGQLTQIGVVRGGGGQNTYYCVNPGDTVQFECPQDTTGLTVTGFIERLGYGNLSDWTPINLFLTWIQQNDPLREVTAKAGNSNWNNPSA